MKALGIMTMAACLVTVDASAGPVVREAAGGNAAAIQSAVDQFRADLGGANNGNTPGSQLFGRREINWDGGGAGATVTLDPSPMTRFAGRGATFLTAGSGFETSGLPTAEFGDLNATYPALFATFSAPRLFAPLNSNVMDVVFHVPGTAAIRAGSTGFGAVFTDVDAASTTWLQFYAPDGALLYERAVPPAAGDETLSFLGVSFDAGEIVGKVRIVTGNAALGPDETAAIDVVAMDDFIYGEPVPVAGLTVSPGSTTLVQSAQIDLVIAVENPPAPIASGRLLYNGMDVTAVLQSCLVPGTLAAGGTTYRCPLPRSVLGAGDHVFQVDLTFGDQSRRRTAVRWTVAGNTEP